MASCSGCSTRASGISALRSSSSCAPTGRWSFLASGDRRRKVDEAIKEVLSSALPELKDPRIGFVTITSVRAARGYEHATVYVSVLGSERDRERTLAGLRAAHGLLQTRVARALGLRRTPVLRFEYDPAIEEGVRLTKMIDDLAPAEPGPPPESDQRDDH